MQSNSSKFQLYNKTRPSRQRTEVVYRPVVLVSNIPTITIHPEVIKHIWPPCSFPCQNQRSFPIRGRGRSHRRELQQPICPRRQILPTFITPKIRAEFLYQQPNNSTNNKKIKNTTFFHITVLKLSIPDERIHIYRRIQKTNKKMQYFYENDLTSPHRQSQKWARSRARKQRIVKTKAQTDAINAETDRVQTLGRCLLHRQ